MENYEGKSAFETFEMQVTQQAQDFLRTAGGWGLFLSIVGFLACGLGLIGSLGMFAAGANAMGEIGVPVGTMGIIFLIGTLVMLLPVIYLFKFSMGVRQAVTDNNTESITKAFKSLKNYFLWAGILTIVWIGSYIVLMAAVFSSAASQFGNM